MKIILSLSRPVGWYTSEERKRISSKTPKNGTELGLYKITLRTSGEDVVIDNYRGFGATLKSKVLFDRGCLVHMKIVDFLALCKFGPSENRAADALVAAIEEGSSIANPLLGISLKTRTVKVHDGRKRAYALQKMGFKFIPIMVFFTDYTSRQIPDWQKFKDFLNSGIKSADNGKLVKDFVLKITHT